MLALRFFEQRGGATRSMRRRIPAGNLETIVIDRLRTFFSARGELLDAIENESSGTAGQGHLITRGRQIAEELGQTRHETKAMIMALVRRVEARSDRIKIAISQDGFAGLLAAQPPDLLEQQPKQTDSSERIMLTAPAQLRRVGREMKLLVGDDANRTPDMGLLRVVARAHDAPGSRYVPHRA